MWAGISIAFASLESSWQNAKSEHPLHVLPFLSGSPYDHFHSFHSLASSANVCYIASLITLIIHYSFHKFFLCTHYHVNLVG